MRKSDVLRVQDVRDAYRLIGDCRDLGGEPALWYVRMLSGLCHLVGARMACGGEGFWIRGAGPIRPISIFDAGFDPRDRELLLAFWRDVGPQGDPLWHALGNVSLERVVTRPRSALIPDAVWCGSTAFNDYRRPAGIHHDLVSVCQVSDRGAVAAINLTRGASERDFSPRDVRLLEFFQAELCPLIGRQLVSTTEPSPRDLSPRLRQALACLLEGDSEKQAAARLGLSPTTMHQYVTALYRRFGVRSRAQLLAHMLRRSGRAERMRSSTADANASAVAVASNTVEEH